MTSSTPLHCYFMDSFIGLFFIGHNLCTRNLKNKKNLIFCIKTGWFIHHYSYPIYNLFVSLNVETSFYRTWVFWYLPILSSSLAGPHLSLGLVSARYDSHPNPDGCWHIALKAYTGIITTTLIEIAHPSEFAQYGSEVCFVVLSTNHKMLNSKTTKTHENRHVILQYQLGR